MDAQVHYIITLCRSVLNQEETGNLNRTITSNEIKLFIKKFPTNKISVPDGFTGKFYQIFKAELANYSKKLKRQEITQTHSMGQHFLDTKADKDTTKTRKL